MQTTQTTPKVCILEPLPPAFICTAPNALSSRRDHGLSRSHGGEETAARLARRRVALSHLIGVIAIAGASKNSLCTLIEPFTGVRLWSGVECQGTERFNNITQALRETETLSCRCRKVFYRDPLCLRDCSGVLGASKAAVHN